MVNYKNFYNSWRIYSKPKRILLIEMQEDFAFTIEKMDPRDFLALTTDAETYKSLMDYPSIREPYKRKMAGTLSLVVEIIKVKGKNIAKVISHEGRNRSVAALKVNAPVEVGIKIVPENSQFKLQDIDGFKSQLSNVVLKTADIIKSGNMLMHSAPAYNVEDPLGLDEENGILKFNGYSAELTKLDANKKLQNYISMQYINHPQAQVGKLMKSAYIAKLNSLYDIVDNNGQKYIFDFADVKFRIDPVTKQKAPSGMKTFNLKPNPLDLYGSEEEANTKTYIITRK